MVCILHSNGKFTVLPMRILISTLGASWILLIQYIHVGVSSVYMRLILFPHSLLGSFKVLVRFWTTKLYNYLGLSSKEISKSILPIQEIAKLRGEIKTFVKSKGTTCIKHGSVSKNVECLPKPHAKSSDWNTFDRVRWKCNAWKLVWPIPTHWCS